jgi:hypothetical protein
VANAYVPPEGETPEPNYTPISEKLQVAMDVYPNVNWSMAHTASPIRNPALNFLGKIWALPLSTINFIYGLVNIPFGAKWTIQYNSISFFNVFGQVGSAFTLGNVVLYGRDLSGPASQSFGAYGDDSVKTAVHEMGHTWQDQRLGIFKPLLYRAAGRFAHISNPWEAAANVAARGYYLP